MHGGDVVISEQGDTKRAIGVYGATINIAARLEQAAKTLGESCSLFRRYRRPPWRKQRPPRFHRRYGGQGNLRSRRNVQISRRGVAIRAMCVVRAA